jgi:lysophospholipase L1-like esterase
LHRLLLALAALAALLTAVPVSATGAEAAADDWWNVAWAFRKRVRVNLPTIQPLDFPYRSAAADQQDDVLAAVASVPCESPPKSTAQREVRVVDAGGNVLPCLASGPDARGDLQVVFPARLRIRGQLGAAIAEDTKQVSITVGRNKAVTPGLRFDVLHGVQRVAVLEVTEVAATAATARVVERNAPTIAPSSPVRSGDLTGAEYWVYYGNPDAKEDSPSWQPPEAPVVEYVWRVSGVPTSLTELRSVLTSDPTLIGTTRRSDINSSANPLGAPGEGYLLCAYDTYIRITTPGLYRFSIDTDGPSFLFVNGRFVAIRPGFFIHSRQWEHRGKVRLTAGYHHLLLLAIETQSNGVVTRLGWQPITAKVYSLAPEGLFAKRMDAEVVGFEARDRREQVFFTYTLANASLQAEGGQRYQFVQFHNVSNPGPAVRDQVTWVWKFGDAEETGPHSPGYLFALDEKTTSFPVTLTALVESKAIGKCQRTVPCEPRPPEKLTLSLEVVSFPNIVYEDERMSVAVRLRNGNRSPVPLQAVGVLRTPREGGEAAETILSSRVTIPAEDESFCILPVDLKALPEKRAEVTLDLSLGGQKVLGTAWRIVPSPEELEDLQGDLGGLYDAQGRRIMVCIRIEDPERHLRWVFYRYARDNLYARAAGTRRRVLLFGDRMANLMPGGKPFADYVSLLQETLTKDGRTLDFVARSTGHLPTLPDVVLFAKTVAGLETLPDIVVLSPGLADIEQAVGERDFARSADVMIDRIRAANDRIKIILVSPPPFPGNPRRSELYTKELGRVAKDHHLPFVHLGKLLTAGQDDWAGAYYAAPHAEGVTLQHPNEDAHRLIADAIRKELH